MLTLYYNIGDGELLNKDFEKIEDYEKFCDMMDNKYGYGGWDNNHLAIW